MKLAVIITVVALCSVALLGVLMGLHQIITYQAQIALEEYDKAYQAKQESDIVTPPETLNESIKSEQKEKSITETIQTEPVLIKEPEPVKTETVQTETIQTEPVEIEPSFSCSGNAKCITGKVTKIIDGDTINVNEKSIRFALISAPELGKSGGIEARSYIEQICPVGSKVIVDEDDGQTGGSYGRTIAEIYCNGISLNESILEANLATIYGKFCSVSEFASEPWAKKFGCN